MSEKTTQTIKPHDGCRLVESGAKATLDECPPGLFLFDGDYGFKTEYRDDNGPEAYCLKSGEYFWGGTKGDKAKRSALLVIPCELVRNAVVQQSLTPRPTPETDAKSFIAFDTEGRKLTVVTYATSEALERQRDEARAQLVEIINCAEEIGKTGKMSPMYFTAADIDEMKVAAGLEKKGGC